MAKSKKVAAPEVNQSNSPADLTGPAKTASFPPSLFLWAQEASALKDAAALAALPWALSRMPGDEKADWPSKQAYDIAEEFMRERARRATPSR